LNSKDKASIQQSFAKVAMHIQRHHPSATSLSSTDMEKDLDKIVDAVKAWLSLADNTRWLMIYDNYDNPKLRNNTNVTALNIHDFLPESDQGSIIITTRVSQVRIGHPIQVKKMDLRRSLEILSSTSKIVRRFSRFRDVRY